MAVLGLFVYPNSEKSMKFSDLKQLITRNRLYSSTKKTSGRVKVRNKLRLFLTGEQSDSPVTEIPLLEKTPVCHGDHWLLPAGTDC